MPSRLDVVTEPNGHTPPPPAPVARDAPPGSMLARLRERAAQQRADRTLDVAVWDDLLIARYGLPPMEDADRLMASAATLVSDGATASMSRTAVDLMATCLRGLYGVNDSGGLEDLDHHRYTGRLLTLLELPLPPGVEDPQDATVAEVIATLFANNWLAVNVHAAKVMDWLQEGGDGLGEAKGGT